jgi:hypothetical protein
MDSTIAGHHVLQVDPANPLAAPLSLAKIPAPNVGILGGDAALDTLTGNFYMSVALSPPSAPRKDAAASWAFDRHAVDWRSTPLAPPTPRPTTQPPPPPVEIDWVVISTRSVAEPHTIRLNATRGEGLQTMDYDPKTASLVGLGSDPAESRCVDVVADRRATRA